MHTAKKTTGFILHLPAEHFVGRKHWMGIPACRRYASHFAQPVPPERQKKMQMISTHNAPRWGAACRYPAIDGTGRAAYPTFNSFIGGLTCGADCVAEISHLHIVLHILSSQS